jgi:hypothetical protein
MLTTALVLIWSPRRDVGRNYIAAGKPQRNAFVKSFNGKLCDESFNDTSLCPPGAPKIGPAGSRIIMVSWLQPGLDDRTQARSGTRGSQRR